MPASLRVAAAAILALLLLLGAMILSEEQLLFPTGAVPAAGPLPPNAEALQVATADGNVLHGVHLKPAVEQDARTLIVGFGGNAWNGQHVAEYLHEAFPEAHVVAFHYRGYRPSTGSPSAEALLEDAPLLLVKAADEVKPEQTVAVGFSIGSGVAASLAGDPRLDALILVTPFDSLKGVASDLYPWLPVGPFFSNEIDAASFLERNQKPVAIIAAERDEIIATARTDGLRRRTGNLRFDRTVPRAGHNDIYGRTDFQSALKDAFEAVTVK